MEKWKKYYIFTTAIIFVIAFVATVIFMCNISQFSADTVENTKTILIYAFFVIALAMIVYFVICGIIVMKRGIYNVRKCDDELFRNIDKYKKRWREDKQYYIKQIQIINLYYKKGGKVDELVKNKEIDRLYARADFLLIQDTFFDNLTTCFYSLAISVIASFMCQMMECKSVLLMFAWMITILLSFFGIILSRYAEKGQMGSYRYLVDKYEKKLLFQKINNLEQKLTVAADDEQILESTQIIINELIRIREKKKNNKQKEKVESDIRQVEQLDLCIGDYSKCKIQNICVNGATCCLAYDREKGKENNYVGELNLINQQYSILFQILSKYGLISKYITDTRNGNND